MPPPAVYYTPEGQPIPNRTLDTPDEINGINNSLNSNYTERDTLYDVFNNFYDEWESAYLHNHTAQYANNEALRNVNELIWGYDGIHTNTPLVLPANHIPYHPETFGERPVPFFDLTVNDDNIAPPPPTVEENDPPPMFDLTAPNATTGVNTVGLWNADTDTDSDSEEIELPLGMNVVGFDENNLTNPNTMEVSDDEMEGAGHIQSHNVRPFFAMN